jgi:hypothetical protein
MDSVPYRKMHPWFEYTFSMYYNEVPTDFRESLWMYMAYGIEPGSFGMAVLRNDFASAVFSAHRMLTADTFRDLAGWLDSCAPRQSWGSKENVEDWIKLTSVERRDIMIGCRLRPSVVDILKGVAVA